MYINKASNVSFNGYDAIRLRGLYMQGLAKNGKQHILDEMSQIAKKENLEIFTNETGNKIVRGLDLTSKIETLISIWGQDLKAFVNNRFGNQVLWNAMEKRPAKINCSVLDGYTKHSARYMPRGGNYYLGQKENGEKWLIINTDELNSEEKFKQYSDKPTERHLLTLFNVKPENIIKLGIFNSDLDEVIRPVGYPFVLVNDSEESLKLLEKVQEKFPENIELYEKLKEYIEKYTSGYSPEHNSSAICKTLEQFGFKPIKIGARFHWDINYINALSWVNDTGNLSYVTNSTKGACKELEYLETLFDKSLKEKMPKIQRSYYVHGGEYILDDPPSIWDSRGVIPRNTIMNTLANYGGGIHCMTAEIPKF